MHMTNLPFREPMTADAVKRSSPGKFGPHRYLVGLLVTLDVGHCGDQLLQEEQTFVRQDARLPANQSGKVGGSEEGGCQKINKFIMKRKGRYPLESSTKLNRKPVVTSYKQVSEKPVQHPSLRNPEYPYETSDFQTGTEKPKNLYEK